MKRKQTYIIEHLEPKLWEWCFIEYQHISEIIGKENLWFTNIKNKKDATKLRRFGKVYSESVKEMMLNNACILDPEANKTLTPGDKYGYFIFGGILGDYPPRKRTKEELSTFLPQIEKRNIGKEQMSTDNAVFTVKQIAGGKKLSELKFVDGASIKINDFESVELPYRYNFDNGKPFMSSEIVKYLKTKKGM